jgi:esterase/lipase superfamily enzyme
LAREALKFRISWLSTGFIIVSPEQPVDVVLLLLHTKRPAWVVVRGSNKLFFVLTSKELKNRLSDIHNDVTVGEALSLKPSQASQRCSSRLSVLELSTVSSDPIATRVVGVNSKGRVIRLGKLLAKDYGRRSAFRVYSARPKTGQKTAIYRSLKQPLTRNIKAKKATANETLRFNIFKEPQYLKRSRGWEYEVQPVLFVTDREDKQAKDGNAILGNERCGDGKLRYGVSYVSIPLSHKRGKLESPSFWRFWRFEFKSNPEKHVLVLRSRLIGNKEFFRRANERICASERREAFVFVHGYNVSFEDAIRRTAQIAHDLRFQGAAILYSWPSRGNWRLYAADEATVDWAQHNFKNFLTRLAAKSQASVIHVIAHSMGNRIAMRALNAIAFSPMTNKTIFKQIVLTAPDVDADEFVILARGINSSAERVTMYASSRDKALRLSRKFHGDAPRAGETGRRIVITEGVDTIDASGVDTSFMAHSYFSTRQTVLSDLFYLITQGHPPDSRDGLTPRTHGNGRYWVFAK